MRAISLENLRAALNAPCLGEGSAPRVTVTKFRALGRPTDYATGRVELDVLLPEGGITLSTRWAAEAQHCPSDGWCVRHAPHLSGSKIQGEILVLDGDGVALSPDSDELEGLAVEFFSQQAIDEWIEPLLPARLEEAGVA